MCTETCNIRKDYQELKIRNNTLNSDVHYWRSRFEDRIGREEALKEKIKELQAKLKYRESQLFGKKREKRSGIDCYAGNNNGNKQESKKRGRRKGSPGHGRKSYDNLDVEIVEHALSDEDKKCLVCGKSFRELTITEESEEIEWEVNVYRKRHKRKRYARCCDCPQTPSIITAPVPDKLIPKGLFSVGFWTKLLILKYLFQLPLSRIIQKLSLQGLEISPGTLTGGLQKIQMMMAPLYDRIVESVRQVSHLHIDESRWCVFEEIAGKDSYQWWIWVFSTSNAVVYVIDPSRSSSVPVEYVGQGEGIILSVDRYSAYKKLAREHSNGLLLAFCWSHVRRDFFNVMKSWKELENWSFKWIDRIGELYKINKERLSYSQDSEDYIKSDEQLRVAINKMEEDRDQELSEDNLHHAGKKVLISLENHWEGLTLFVDHPHIPMDNNEAERCLRNPILGRKNYYGSGSVWSAEFSAMMFTVLQTARKNGINPEKYLRSYLKHCAANGGNAPEDLGKFLSWDSDLWNDSS